jgi:hypothetical protein
MLRQLSYLDDLLILTNRSFKDHLLKLEMVLVKLSTAGMRVNIFQSKFFTEQIEYLGYWITRLGIQPICNKFEAILNIKAPKTRKELKYVAQRLFMFHLSSMSNDNEGERA